LHIKVKVMLVCNVSAVKYDERYLELSWIWLNDEDIRRLTLTPLFTKEQQRTWFESLATRKDYVIWGVELEGKPIGAFGIKHMDRISGEYWGYLGEKETWGHGIGQWMVNESISYARKIGLLRLWLKVSKENIRAIHLYTKCGFRLLQNEGNVLLMELRL
jgi:RimJ/RimL family protein N-acetyltransferase